MNRKKLILLTAILLLACLIFILQPWSPNSTEGLSRHEVEQKLGKTLSDEEWNKMTENGPIIGVSDQKTEIKIQQ